MNNRILRSSEVHDYRSILAMIMAIRNIMLPGGQNLMKSKKNGNEQSRSGDSGTEVRNSRRTEDD